MNKSVSVYILLFSLYWAQGLPVGFMTHALPVILRAEGVSLSHIGGFGLLLAPWAIKFLWAPWIDRMGLPKYGHFRGWILLTQGLVLVFLLQLSFLPVEQLHQSNILLLFFCLLLAINFCGATQDIATDGLAVHLLKSEQQHWGNSIQVIGSRLGFLVGGGALLWSLDWLYWQMTFLLLTLLVFINSWPIFKFKEPPLHQVPSAERRQGKIFQQYKTYFLQSKHLQRWLLVLLTIKMVDGLSGPILKPLLVDLGLSLSQMGLYVTMLGALAALLGAGVAGWSLKFFSRAQALILFSILKILCLLPYLWLALQHRQHVTVEPWIIYLIHAVEDFSASMLLVILLTLIMQYSRKDSAGADFTLQVSLMAMVSGGLYVVSGFLGDLLGYVNYLILLISLALLNLAPVFYWAALQRTRQ